MKKFSAFVLALLMLLAMGNAAMADRLDDILAAGKITVATSPDFAPMEFIDPTKTGQDSVVGAEVELMKYIAEKLGVELVIEQMDFQAALAAASMGNVDIAASGMAWREERAEAMELSAFYNMEDDDGQGILIRAEDADKYKTAADFVGKKVAVQNSSLQYNLLTEQIPEAVPELITNLNDAVMMLLTGKVDAVGVAYDNGEGFVTNYPDDLVMSEFKYEYLSEGNVLGVKKGETALIERINEIIAEVNELKLFTQWNADAEALAASFGI
ncbi:MAG: transporter substrate-binding domain-containing protein [Oscillospiraceae bacterium]|jgi:polar amino acid transport system substrate-binding protein|nr:transporter substrate-binding domain-containing protein [Oscillospiraceae bacterium]